MKKQDVNPKIEQKRGKGREIFAAAGFELLSGERDVVHVNMISVIILPHLIYMLLAQYSFGPKIQIINIRKIIVSLDNYNNNSDNSDNLNPDIKYNPPQTAGFSQLGECKEKSPSSRASLSWRKQPSVTHFTALGNPSVFAHRGAWPRGGGRDGHADGKIGQLSARGQKTSKNIRFDSSERKIQGC